LKKNATDDRKVKVVLEILLLEKSLRLEKKIIEKGNQVGKK
jgi:hypothetical protein